MSDANFYYESNGQQAGPITAAQLKALAVSGELKPTDMVWKDGMPDWVAAGSVRGLFPEGVVPQRPAAPTSGDMGRQAAAVAKEAAQQSIGAVKILFSDPVGGIGKAYEGLGPSKALPVGIVFLAVFFVCYIVSSLIGSPPGIPVMPGGATFKLHLIVVLSMAAAVGAMIGICVLVRTLYKSAASIPADIFVVGVSLLPVAVGILVTGVFEAILKKNMFLEMLSMSVLVMAFAFTIFLLFSGMTKIYSMPERAASLWVPGTLIVGLNVLMLAIYLLAKMLF